MDTTFTAARRSLILDHSFFGALAMHLAPVEDADAQRGVWVDGERIGYNPASLEQMGIANAAGVLAKGILHCAFGHHVRRGTRDKDLWQQAADLVLNPEILDSDLSLPPGAVLDRTYQGKAVEEVYSILYQQQQQQQPQGGGDKNDGNEGNQSPQQAPESGDSGDSKSGSSNHPQTGEVRDLPGESDGNTASQAEQSHSEQEWKVNLQVAMQIAESRGELPGNFKTLIKQALAPHISWKAELRRFMQALSKDDISWAVPNRRFLSQGIHLPASRSTKMGTMVVVNDTSGSTAAAQPKFFAEMRDILEDVAPERIIYIQIDSRIQRVDELSSGDEFDCTIRGGGGTDFRPAFAYIEQEGISPDCMVFLTDLYGPFPVQAPDYPVLWAVVGKATEVPFGDLIKVDIHQD